MKINESIFLSLIPDILEKEKLLKGLRKELMEYREPEKILEFEDEFTNFRLLINQCKSIYITNLNNFNIFVSEIFDAEKEVQSTPNKKASDLATMKTINKKYQETVKKIDHQNMIIELYDDKVNIYKRRGDSINSARIQDNVNTKRIT